MPGLARRVAFSDHSGAARGFSSIARPGSGVRAWWRRRLLTELGMSPADAIRRVRAARPGAIETEAQAAWVSSGPTVGDGSI